MLRAGPRARRERLAVEAALRARCTGLARMTPTSSSSASVWVPQLVECGCIIVRWLTGCFLSSRCPAVPSSVARQRPWSRSQRDRALDLDLGLPWGRRWTVTEPQHVTSASSPLPEDLASR